MKTFRILVFLLALVVTQISCKKENQSMDSGTDNAKLRPEVAAASKGTSPGPTSSGANVTPTP
ncbi:MAG: hypothetical protein M3N12_09830 [Verrucomicrobiota bacterium]|nr:hypothetical protein [Verrucomicrobiota bacterium]